MASSFWESNFYFNNIHSSTYKVCIVDINERDILKQIGSSFSISMDKEIAYNGNPLYKEGERLLDNFTIQLCKTNNEQWSATSIAEIIDWIFQDTFKKFQPMDLVDKSYNLVYYVKAIGYSKHLNTKMEGYLEIIFQLYDAYAYAIPNNVLLLNGGETKTINNLSNINKIYYPKMKITNLGSETNVITITNQTNKKTLSLTNVKANETITIDCAIGSVLDKNGNNRFSVLQNFDFIGFNKGNNTISLSKNCTVEFICEFPMII